MTNIIRFRTETGTVYEIDIYNEAWRRVSTTERSGFTRSQSGYFKTVPEVVVGQPVYINNDNEGDPDESGLIRTSPVVEIL